MRPPPIAARRAPTNGRANGSTDETAALVGTDRLEQVAPPRSLIGRIADTLTVIGVFMAPLYGKRIGNSLTGFAYADVVLFLALMARGVHLLTAGLRRRTLQRHSFLLGSMGLFAILALISAFVNGTNPLELGYDRVVIATLGSVLLVATFGDQEEGARRVLLHAFGLGCIVLSLSSFGGLKLSGRPLGWSVHPNALGHSCMMGMAVAVWLWDNAKAKLQRWFWAGAVALNFVAIMNSGSRGALLGIWMGSMLYFALRGNRRLVVGALFATLFIILALAIGAVHLPANNPLTRLLSQGQSNSNSGYSDQARTQLLTGDIARIDAAPFFGDGFGDIVNVHVAYLQGWVAAGALAGLVTMVVGFVMLILPFLTRRRDLALACGAAAVATAWLFTNIFTARDQWLFLAIAFSSAQSISVLGRGRTRAVGRQR